MVWFSQKLRVLLRYSQRPEIEVSTCSRARKTRGRGSFYRGIILVDTGLTRTHTRARAQENRASYGARSQGSRACPIRPRSCPLSLSLSFLHPLLVCRSRRPVNELQGCKSESWLNCLLSRVELGFAPSSAFFLLLFSAVCPRGVATMFLHPPTPFNPLRLASLRELGVYRDQKERAKQREKNRNTMGSVDNEQLFTIACFVPNFIRNRIRPRPAAIRSFL